MNIKEITQIVNSDLPNSIKESLILLTLANDPQIIPYMLEILENERKQSKELILDSNAELSRALLTLDKIKVDSKKEQFIDPKWVVGEIKKHYLKYKDYIKCNFKINGLP